MTDDNRDLLRATFASHENLAPDAEAVYARVNEIAKGHRWRRRGLQAAGGVALGAGIIAGVIAVPYFVPSQQTDGFQVAAPGSPEASPAAPAPVTPGPVPSGDAELQRGWDAYFGAGYGYSDAEALAKLWNSKEQIGTVKAQAGHLLLAGQTLPVEPTGAEEEENLPEPDPEAQAAFKKFFDTGYTWDEAEQLAELWNLEDPSEAKIEAGKKLIAGEDLPVRPKPANVEAAKDNMRIEAFFEAGYDYDDAVELAQIWKLDDAGQAKVEGGKRLLAGRDLPIKP